MQTRPATAGGEGERSQQLTRTNKIQPDVLQTTSFSTTDLNHRVFRVAKINTFSYQSISLSQI